MSHTPGPLFVEIEQKFPFNLRIVDSGGDVVATEHRCCYSTDHRTLDDVMTARGFKPAEKRAAIEANARQLADMFLRAAAPELLEALVNAVNELEAHEGWAEDGFHDDESGLIANLRGVIAKARGES